MSSIGFVVLLFVLCAFALGVVAGRLLMLSHIDLEKHNARAEAECSFDAERRHFCKELDALRNENRISNDKLLAAQLELAKRKEALEEVERVARLAVQGAGIELRVYSAGGSGDCNHIKHSVTAYDDSTKGQ